MERVLDATGLIHFNDDLSRAGGLPTLCDLTMRVSVRPALPSETGRGTCMHCADGARRLNPDGSYKPTRR